MKYGILLVNRRFTLCLIQSNNVDWLLVDGRLYSNPLSHGHFSNNIRIL